MPKSPEQPDMGHDSADYVVGRHRESSTEGVSLFENFQDVIRKNIEDNEKTLEDKRDNKYLPNINPEDLEFLDMVVHDKMLSGSAGKLSEKEFANYQKSVQDWAKEELGKGVLTNKAKVRSRMAFMGRLTGLWAEEVKRRKEAGNK